MGIAVGKTYDPSAVQFLGAIQNRDFTIGKAINDLVIDLKIYNLWDKMKAIYPFVGGTAESHKWNLKDPRDADSAFRLTFSGSWIHSTTGATPSGSTGYADSKLKPQSQLSASNIHVSAYSRTQFTNNDDKWLWGAYDGSNFVFVDLYNSSNGITTNGGSSYITATYGSSKGLFTTTITGTGTNQQKTFLNNIEKGTNTNTSTGLPNLNLYYGAGNFNGSIYAPTPFELAFASAGDGLTDSDVTNYYTAVQRFQTTLGRQV